jgi:hypothetical protein
MVMVVDANTGKHRTTVNIEKAAKLRMVETANAPRFRNAESPYSPETDGAHLCLPQGPLHDRRSQGAGAQVGAEAGDKAAGLKTS